MAGDVSEFNLSGIVVFLLPQAGFSSAIFHREVKPLTERYNERNSRDS